MTIAEHPVSVPPSAGGAVAVRKTPSQQRSRDRIERILQEAASLIASRGSDALKMSEVAAKAEISIGSLYQYFPEKGSVLQTLAGRYNAVGRLCIEEELKKARTASEFADAFDRLIDIYYATFLANPVMRDIWFGVQADRNLHPFLLNESRLNGKIVATELLRVRPDGDHENVEVAALTIMHLGEEAVRLAISMPKEEGARIIGTFKRMARCELQV